jgi:hypothetical protein
MLNSAAAPDGAKNGERILVCMDFRDRLRWKILNYL